MPSSIFCSTSKVKSETTMCLNHCGHLPGVTVGYYNLGKQGALYLPNIWKKDFFVAVFDKECVCPQMACKL